MTKQDVVQQICQRTGQSTLTSRAVIESFFEVVKQQLSQGEPVTVRGFGTFAVRQRAARSARHISQNTAYPVEAQLIPYVKPSNKLTQQVRHRPAAVTELVEEKLTRRRRSTQADGYSSPVGFVI